MLLPPLRAKLKFLFYPGLRLASLFLLISWAVLPTFFSALAATSYVDATSGRDTNTGLSEATAWKTIAKVNASRFNPGDQILFKRGEIWRGQLIVPSSGSNGNPIAFGAYGDGIKPKILGSVNLGSTESWSLYSENIWKSSIASVTDIGNLIFNNEASVGVKKSAKVDCTTQGDFFWDSSGNYLYLYSTSNPAAYYSAIEAARNIDVIYMEGKGYVTIQDLDIRYSAVNGINLSGWSAVNENNNIIIQRNSISYCGGYKSGGVRCGNGIQVFGFATNIIARYNRVDNIYDQGLDIEIWTAGHRVSNVSFYYNVVSNCECSIGFGFQGDSVTTSDTIKFENNVLFNAGGSWGHSQRPDPFGHNLFYWLTTMPVTNLFFRNNIFLTATGKNLYIEWKNPIAGLTSNYNLFYPDGASAFSYLGNTYNFANYKTTSGKDAHSISSDPLFVSIFIPDFHLQSTSPARNAGTSVGLTLDYEGNPVRTPPNIGAYENHKLAAPTALKIITD